ncbi:MAG: type II secretion system F family protein [Lachnospiraceae bacterium]|nr:type II secretion system F family protein [Lachnospiraceae bacterium]
MAQFNYKVIDKDGKSKKGVIEARDLDTARNKLRDNGMTVVAVKEQGFMDQDIQIGGGKKVKPRDLSVFCKQFAAILNAGVTIIAALDMISESTDHPTMKRSLKEAAAHVEKGGTLADAFKLNPKVFPQMLVNMVAAGESSGNMEIAFERLSTHFEKESALEGKIKGALTYPIIVLIIAVVVIIVMLIKVIPTFTDMFNDMGIQLPFATRAMVAASNFVLHKWYILIAIVVAISVIFKAFGATESGQQAFSQIAIHAPIFGDLTVKSNCARFSRNMSTLMASGIALIDALEQVAKMLSNKVYRDGLLDAKIQVSKGVPMSKPLKDMEVFPVLLTSMVKIGEETGNIEEMMDKVADFYDEEVDQATANLTAALEPLTMVLMAGIVGMIVAAVYGPILSLYSNMDNL